MPHVRCSSSALAVVLAFALAVGPLPAHAAPVETPPPVQFTARVFAADSPTDEDFGYSVAIDGNTAVVGSPGYNGKGAVFVYEYVSGLWTFSEELPADSGVGDRFGHSVDIDGDLIVVGMPYGNSSAADDTGAAIVYERGLAGWVYLTELAPEPSSVGDRFGWSVAISGNRAVVGSPKDDQMATDSGAIYIFTRTEPASVKYMSSAAEGGAEYGTSVDLDGDSIIVGAPRDDTAAGADAGAVHFYHWDGGFWDYQGIRFGSSDDAGDRFGYAVSISGDRALAGAFLDDVATADGAGSTDVFNRSGTNWFCAQTLVSPAPNTGDNFGMAVSVGGTFALVGAPWDDGYAGSVHVYQCLGGTWTLMRKMTPLSGDSLAGFSVAASSQGRGVVGNVTGDGAQPASGTACMLAHLEPVYRFYNAGAGTHFFTNSAEERDHVIATWPTVFTYEGPAYNTNPHNNAQPLYRFYKPSSSSHFYTASLDEANHVLATWPHIYSYDGPTYAVTPYAGAGKLPVYRFYNVRNGSHFYTASETEKANVIARWPDIYTYEGPAFWLGQ